MDIRTDFPTDGRMDGQMIERTSEPMDEHTKNGVNGFQAIVRIPSPSCHAIPGWDRFEMIRNSYIRSDVQFDWMNGATNE